MTSGMRSPEVTEVMTRVGRFTDRDAWDAAGWCSIERALELVGTRSAMILLRESFYGGRRFDELARRTGLSEAVTAKRLKQLVDHGVLSRQPYQDLGARARDEYVLTERGRALFPVLVALIRWGDTLESRNGGIGLTHAGCGAKVDAVVQCESGHEVTIAQTQVRLAHTAQRNLNT